MALNPDDGVLRPRNVQAAIVLLCSVLFLTRCFVSSPLDPAAALLHRGLRGNYGHSGAALAFHTDTIAAMRFPPSGSSAIRPPPKRLGQIRQVHESGPYFSSFGSIASSGKDNWILAACFLLVFPFVAVFALLRSKNAAGVAYECPPDVCVDAAGLGLRAAGWTRQGTPSSVAAVRPHLLSSSRLHATMGLPTGFHRGPSTRLSPLRGISGYSDVLDTWFKGATQPANAHRPSDVVCVDVNDLLHTSIQRANTKRQYIKNLERSIKLVLGLTRPQEKLCIFIDGPASHAKMLLQRERRSESNRPDFEMGKMSSLDLTAGCELLDWLQQPLARFLQSLSGFGYFLSDLKDPGEGEVKMIRWLKENRVEYAKSRLTIVGRDADLFVLSLCALDYSHIQLLRGDKWIDVESILKEMQKWTGPVDVMDLAHHPMRLELSIVTMMMGNDYFPSLVYRRDWLVQKFVRRYKGNLTPEGHWALKDNLIVTPDARIRREGLMDFLRFLGEGVAPEAAAPASAADCRRVLDGWAWCLWMYTVGRCAAPRWYFAGSAVTPQQLLAYLEEQPYDLVPIPFSEDPFVEPVVAALATLPYVGRQCVPEGYRHLFDAGSPLKDLFPEPCVQCAEDRASFREVTQAYSALQAELAAVQARTDKDFSAAKLLLDSHGIANGLAVKYKSSFDPQKLLFHSSVEVGDGAVVGSATSTIAGVANAGAAREALRALRMDGGLPPQEAPAAEEDLPRRVAEAREQLTSRSREHAKHLQECHEKMRVLPIERIERAVETIAWAPDPDPYPTPGEHPDAALLLSTKPIPLERIDKGPLAFRGKGYAAGKGGKGGGPGVVGTGPQQARG
eukprot:EG_transcript_3222